MQQLMKKAWPFLCLLAAPGLVGCSNSHGQPNGAQGRPAEVSVSAVLARTVSDYEDFPGWLEAVNSIDIRSRVTGFLTKVHFKEGDIVQKDSVLFEIDARPYKAEMDRTEGVVLQMEGRLKRLEAEFQRAAKLLPKTAISVEDYDKVVGDRTEAEGNLKVAAANRETAKLKLGWTEVRAPLTGRIGRRFIDPGNLVKEDETILTTIVDLDPIYVYFDPDERTTLRFQELIREGWSNDAKLPVYMGLANEEHAGTGEHMGFPHKGTIHFADNRVDKETGTWRLRGLFENNTKRLSPGLFVRVRLPIGGPHDAKLVAEQALGTDQGQKFVYVVKDIQKVTEDNGDQGYRGTVASRQVKIGRLHHGLRAVTEGLDVGDQVIVSGLQRARPGAPVVPVTVAMPGDGQADKEKGRQGDKEK